MYVYNMVQFASLLIHLLFYFYFLVVYLEFSKCSCQTLQILSLDHVYSNTFKFTSVYYYFDFGYRVFLIPCFVFCLIPFNFTEVNIVSITYFVIQTFI